MYCWACSGQLTLALSFVVSIRCSKTTGCQTHGKRDKLLAKPHCDPHSKQWLMVWLIHLLMSARPMLNKLHCSTAIISELHPLWVCIPYVQCCSVCCQIAPPTWFGMYHMTIVAVGLIYHFIISHKWKWYPKMKPTHKFFSSLSPNPRSNFFAIIHHASKR